MQSHVDSDHGFCQIAAAAEVTDCSQWRRGWKPAANDHVGCGQRRAPHSDAGSSTNRNVTVDCDLDRIAGRQVETMQPPCGRPGERKGNRHALEDRAELQKCVLSQAGPRILAAAQSSPVISLQCLPLEAELSCLVDSKWTPAKIKRCGRPHDYNLCPSRRLMATPGVKRPPGPLVATNAPTAAPDWAIVRTIAHLRRPRQM